MREHSRPHRKLDWLGEEKGEKGVNKYYRCLICGSVLIIPEERSLYEV
jgi:ribosomal protein S26